MTYDRRAIMKAAWAGYRSVSPDALAKMKPAMRRMRFAYSLRWAWADAKYRVEQARPQPVLTRSEILAARINDMENRDRLGWQGIEELGRLRHELIAAQNEEAAKLVVFRSRRSNIHHATRGTEAA